MDRVERKITKRNEIERRNEKFGEKSHEFATLGHYKDAMVGAYRKTKQEQQDDNETTSSQR